MFPSKHMCMMCEIPLRRGLERLEVYLPVKQITMVLKLLDPKDEDSVSFHTFETLLLGGADLTEDSMAGSVMTSSISAPSLSLSKMSIS